MIRLKNEAELNKIRESCRLLAQTFTALDELISPGVTLKKLDTFAQQFIENREGVPAFLGYQGFPASICASVNDVVIHGIPDERQLDEGDILSIDMGVILDGYYSDAAYTYAIGGISEEAERLLSVTQECLRAGISAAVAGNRVKDISEAVFNVADGNGYGVVYQFCGHGTGFDLHEDPQIPNYVSRGPNPRLKPGMVIAIEPMINTGTGDIVILDDGWTVETADHGLSAHFEHTLAILEDETEILTAAGEPALNDKAKG